MTEYGIQLYSVRDLAQAHLEEALRGVAEMGYRYVEFAGSFGHSAEEVRAMLDNYGLKISGTHTGWQELTPDHFQETVAYHRAIGTPNIIIPGADLSTREKLEDLISLIRDVQPRLREEGISLGYHNHSHEFITTAYGAQIHRELEERTDVEFEIDTYWAYVAGQDPIALLKRLADRVRVIHLKDGMADGHGMALGEGSAPVKAVREYAREQSLRIVVESETCQPTGMEEVGRCMRYLRGLEP